MKLHGYHNVQERISGSFVPSFFFPPFLRWIGSHFGLVVVDGIYVEGLSHLVLIPNFFFTGYLVHLAPNCRNKPDDTFELIAITLLDRIRG